MEDNLDIPGMESQKLTEITGPVIPTWTQGENPKFLERSSTVYAKFAIDELEQRGIKNRLFDSLIAGLPEGCYISGGFMVSLLLGDKNSKDIDIFCNSESAFKEICNMILNLSNKSRNPDEESDSWAYEGYNCTSDKSFNNGMNKDTRFLKFVNENDRRPDIQVMKMCWYDSPDHVIDTFDFTIVQICADREFIYMNPLTQLDLASKRLVLHRMQFPASTIRRLIKYANKGYYACPGSLVNISKNIQGWAGDTDIDETNFVYLD